MTIVQINDGQTTWLADRDKLIAALDALGYQKVEGGRVPPESDFGAAPGEDSYSRLCERLSPLEGGLPSKEFYWAPDRKMWVWASLVGLAG